MKTYATLAITAAISSAASLDNDNIGDFDSQNRSLNFYDATIQSMTTETTIHNYYSGNEDGEPVEDMSNEEAERVRLAGEAAEEAERDRIAEEAEREIIAQEAAEEAERVRLAEEVERERIAQEASEEAERETLTEGAQLAVEEAESGRFADMQRIEENYCVNTCLDFDSFDITVRPPWYQMGAFVEEVLSRTNHLRDAGLLVQGQAKTVNLQNEDRNVVGETFNGHLHGWSCYGPGCTDSTNFVKTDILSYIGHPVFVRRQYAPWYGYSEPIFSFSVDSNGNDKHGFHTSHLDGTKVQNYEYDHNASTNIGFVAENEAYWTRDGSVNDIVDCDSTWTDPETCVRTWAFGPSE